MPRSATACALVLALALARLSAAGLSGGQSPVGSITVAEHQGAVTGIASHRSNGPIGRAIVRLRDVTSGRISSESRTDDSGRFTFRQVPAGRYVVELVDEDRRVVGVGQVFTMSTGEAVSTSVHVGTGVPWFKGFFLSAAAAALATAATIGVTALGDGQPASPRF